MCPSLFQDLAKVDDRIRAAARISLFLDFDGTLVPLRPDPAELHLSEHTPATLIRFIRTARTRTPMLHGRPCLHQPWAGEAVCHSIWGTAKPMEAASARCRTASRAKLELSLPPLPSTIWRIRRQCTNF